jgi:succinoglycan biosynthesis protein ExoL
MNIENLRVLSALPVLGQPRHAKRIAMLLQTGFEVEAVAFERDYHCGRLPCCPVERLGQIAHGSYLQRILKMINAFPRMRSAMRRNDIIYASGPDMALFALVAGLGLHKPIIIEIGDLTPEQFAKGYRGYMIRALDRFVVNSSRLLVVTASGFVDYYYRKRLKTRTPVLVLENKLEIPVFDSDRITVPVPMKGTPLLDRQLRIGYFGLLRCDWSWKILESLALSRPDDVKIVVAGYPTIPVDLVERAAKLSNVEFLGEFQSPKDLPALYGNVDLVWGCFPIPSDQNDLGWMWARTNRFYESCLFQRPIIVLAGSGDAAEVKRYGIGMIVGGDGIADVTDVLSGIKLDDILRWRENISKVPQRVYLYTTEIEELRKALEDIVTDYLEQDQK